MPMPMVSEKGFGRAVGVEADDRLEQRGGDVEGERDDADLGEVEGEGILQHRVDRRQQRLDHVVEEVGEADRDERGDGGRLGWAGKFGAAGSVVHGREGLSVEIADCGGRDAGL